MSIPYQNIRDSRLLSRYGRRWHIARPDSLCFPLCGAPGEHLRVIHPASADPLPICLNCQRAFDHEMRT